MAGWKHSAVAAIGRWRLDRKMNREALTIAREISGALWENVRRKIAGATENDLAAYAKVRAAQLCQERVDELMQANPAVPGVYATQLLLKTTDRAVAMALAAAANATKSAA
jgi:hypothetical protein